MEYIIEKAKPSDKEEIIEVLKPWNMHNIILKDPKYIDFNFYYVARVDGKIVGCAGFILLSDTKARTRLLAVYPELQGTGIGKALQDYRLEQMYKMGIKTVVTHADRDEIILWYKKHYGYKETGEKKKVEEHGLNDKSISVTMEMDLEFFMKNKKQQEERKEEYILENDSFPLSPYKPLIINVALTGMVPTKTSTPFVPISVNEIVEDALKVCEAGATMLHIHARDKDGIPVSDARYFEEIISRIKKEKPDVVCCATTSGRGGQGFERRSEVLHITGDGKPDMASLTLGSLNFLSGASINSLDTIQRLAMLMKEKNIKPELEVFDTGMVNAAKYMERHGIIEGRKYFNILLGNLNTASATIDDLSHIYNSLPTNSIWAAAGIGQFQLPMNMAAIIAGGNVRVGLEDNIYFDSNKEKLATNEMLVKRLVNISKELGREVATYKETRELIGL